MDDHAMDIGGCLPSAGIMAILVLCVVVLVIL
jgi:hypothetical protein